MKKLLLLSLLSIIFLMSCEKEEMDLPSSYPQLNGSYSISSYKSWNNGLYEESKFESWDFDNTRRALNYYNNWSYTTDGWINALKKGTSFDKEWKVENGKFYERLWENEYSEWTSQTFEYINSTSFKLNGILFTKN